VFVFLSKKSDAQILQQKGEPGKQGNKNLNHIFLPYAYLLTHLTQCRVDKMGLAP